MPEEQTYRFKWSNFTLADYLAARNAQARNLRHQAEILQGRADQIEEEVAEIRSALVVNSDA